MAEFTKPSDMFRWALQEFDSGNAEFSLKACFPQYWQHRHDSGYLWAQYDRRLEALVRNAKPSRSILEVGSGFGMDACWSAIAGANVLGIDVKSTFVEISNKLGRRVGNELGLTLPLSFRRTNLLELQNSHFDFIYMKDVFHHLEPRELVVAKIASLLRPGGELLIVEPNAFNPLIQLQMLRIRGFNTIIEKTDSKTGERFIYGNERLITAKALREVFKRVGVTGHTKSTRLLPTALASHQLLTKLATALEQRGVDQILPPTCVHTIYWGVKHSI